MTFGGLGVILRQGSMLAETRRLTAAMTVQPSAARRGLINSTIARLKTAGLWAKLDALYMMASHAEQAGRLNWKVPGTWTLGAFNSPVFSTDRGFAGDGVAAYMVANSYNPSTAGGSYGLNGAVTGIYVHAIGNVANAYDLFGTNGSLRLQLASGAASYTVRVNDGSTLSTGASSLAVGHWAARRSSAAAKDVWRNGALQSGPDASASTSVPTTFALLSTATGSGNWNNSRLSFAYTAGLLTDAEMVSLNTILTNYLRTVGAA